MKNIKELFKGPLVIYGVIGVIMIVVIVVIAVVIVPLFAKKTYNSLEEKLLHAAELYYEGNKNNLPSKINDKTSISSAQLITAGYLSEMKDPSNKEIICTGTVEVLKLNDELYSYHPTITCGTNYHTQTLSSILTDNNMLVTDSDGIYKIGNEFIFRGEKVNNYVKFNDKLWYIIKITETGEIKLILSESLDETNVFDDRYNSDKGWNTGYNLYEKSRIKDTLLNYYNNDLADVKSSIVPMNLCVGGRKIDATDNSGAIECTTLLENQNISLIQTNEYIVASLDKNCDKVNEGECSNYNYFSRFQNSYWTLTPNFENTYEVYQIYDGISLSNASTYSNIYPVIYLNRNAIYSTGDGTIENPYLIR